MVNLLAAMAVTQSARTAMLDRAIADGGDALETLAERFLSDEHVDSWRG